MRFRSSGTQILLLAGEEVIMAMDLHEFLAFCVAEFRRRTNR